MTSCKHTIDQLLSYLEGELPADVKARLEEHFGGCQPCEEFLKTYRETPGLCKKALLAKEMPKEFAAKLTDFLRAEFTRSKK